MMKYVFLFLLACTISFPLFAQTDPELISIDTTEVPPSVQEIHAMYFSGAGTTKWYKQQAGDPSENTSSLYTATFDFQGYPTKAQYTSDGTAIAASMQIEMNTLPVPVQKLINTKYSAHNFVKGENIRSMQTGKEIFKITLEDGSEQKVLYTDDKGVEMETEALPSELKQ